MKNWKDDDQLCGTAQRILRASEVPEHLYMKYGKRLHDENNMFDILRAIDYPTIERMSNGKVSYKDWRTFKEVWENI